MDEKTFTRIIPVVIAIAVLIIQYLIKNQKKKNLTASSIPPVSEVKKNIPGPDSFKPVKSEQYNEEAESLETIVLETDDLSSESKNKVKKSTFQAMHKNIKPTVLKPLQLKENEKSVLTFTEDEIKKAIIYSEILNPKHF